MHEHTINETVKEVIKYLLYDYKFDCLFTEEELKKLGFLYSDDIKWPDNPIIVESGEGGFNGIQFIAFGGVIGEISFDNPENKFSSKIQEKIREHAKYLAPNKANQEWFIDGYGHKFVLPKKLVERYSGNRTEIVKKAISDKTSQELLTDKKYLDLIIGAALVRWMSRDEGVMTDVGERSMQSIIARANLDNQNDNNLIVVDVEYKIKLSKKNPSVDFVVFDKKDSSIGLIEFKYQGESMDKGTKNSLTEHFNDFVEMICTNKNEIINDVTTFRDAMVEYEILDKKISGKKSDKLWCGFYFVSEKEKKTSRNHVQMKLVDRIEYDCKEQLQNIYNGEISSEIDVRFQHTDISEYPWNILMEDSLPGLAKE